jgi:hypothetical protein
MGANPYADDCSYLSYTPTTPFAFSQLTNLMATYTFTNGSNCHGGALRWSVTFASGANMYIYYGADSGFWTDCTSSGSTTNQSTLNMIVMPPGTGYNGGAPDTRYETPGGSQMYKAYSDAATWAAGQGNVVAVTLVLDAGWQQQCGIANCDQTLTLGGATVNSDVFTPPPPVSIGPTCALPTAKIQVAETQGTDTGPVNTVLSASAADTTGYFRIVDCHYMYNLDVSSLLGAGTYSVNAVINGTPTTPAATFTLK